jgi:hypothetical protein
MLFSIGATEDAASGRAARPDGTAVFRQTLCLGEGVRPVVGGSCLPRRDDSQTL